MKSKNESMQSLRIHVEDHHIEHAQRKNSHHCMIADAIKDALPEAKYISVDLQSIRFSFLDKSPVSRGTRYTYFTPTIAQHALLKFDQGIKVREFEFTARTGIMRNIPWPKKDKVKRRHDISKRVKKHIVRKEREFGLRIFDPTYVPKPVVEPVNRKLISSIRRNISRAI